MYSLAILFLLFWSVRLFDKLFDAVKVISEASGKEIPVLKVEKEEVDATKGISLWDGGGAVGDGGPYGDLESKSFYEDLPDLLSMVPLAALGISSEQAQALKEKWKVSYMLIPRKSCAKLWLWFAVGKRRSFFVAAR